MCKTIIFTRDASLSPSPLGCSGMRCRQFLLYFFPFFSAARGTLDPVGGFGTLAAGPLTVSKAPEIFGCCGMNQSAFVSVGPGSSIALGCCGIVPYGFWATSDGLGL